MHKFVNRDKDMNVNQLPGQDRLISVSQLIGADEAAEILGIERSAFTKRIHAGTVKPLTKLSGARGAYIFDREEIQKLAKEAKT